MSRIPNVGSIVLAIVKEHFADGCYVNQVLEVFQKKFPQLEHKSARVKVDKSLRLLQRKGALASILDAGNKRRYTLVIDCYENASPQVDLNSYMQELKRTEYDLAATLSEWEYMKSIDDGHPVIVKAAKECALELEQDAMKLTGKYSGLKKIISRVTGYAS
ncbi:MAG: hypothetical protein KKE08_13845 [Gammaproteobacteria bacterium]|nr:hypothetical protein [Gammaproteobacteria bacterium]MBU2072576.1 hypothetical protein [Gammaproteobacteria bacterium]MBU2184106.1 hypothetical protein [Gammaproteobacteria bacterium]MBU2206808.1 hypothetical protein [Gammaproteobacteria bacterium]